MQLISLAIAFMVHLEASCFIKYQYILSSKNLFSTNMIVSSSDNLVNGRIYCKHVYQDRQNSELPWLQYPEVICKLYSIV